MHYQPLFVYFLYAFLGVNLCFSSSCTYSKEKNKILTHTSVKQVSLSSKSEKAQKDKINFDEIIKPFLNVKYVAGTLEQDTEKLVINLKEVDCTTFVEYVVAAQIVGCIPNVNNQDYCKCIQQLRYKKGIINRYPSRLHYFSDWIDSNVNERKLLHEVSTVNNSVGYKKKINFMTTHLDSYEALKKHPEYIMEIKNVEDKLSTKTFYYLPKEQLSNEKLNHLLHHGDLIAITTDIKGLDIQHVGFAYNNKGTFQLLHASSMNGKVMIDNKPLLSYLQNNKHATGIRVLRVNK